MSLFQSNSIGVSSHKNEYQSGVRVGNWVEEMFGAEAEAGGGDSLKVSGALASEMPGGSHPSAQHSRTAHRSLVPRVRRRS